jgi:hypothetical protein
MAFSEKSALDILAIAPLPARRLGARNAKNLQKKGLARPVRWKGSRPKELYLELTNAGAKAAGFKSL